MIRACLSIAVSRPEGELAELPGTIAAVHGIAAWARAAGFDLVEIVTDERPGTEVSVAGLRLLLRKLIGDEGVVIDHLVVHFAGHGFHDEYDDQLLLLTRWLSDPAEAINLRRFVRLLEFYQPRRVSLLIDACRSDKPSSASDLHGSGILERLNANRQEFLEDRFRASRAGRDAFMVRDLSGGPTCCLFTAVLLKTLHGDYAEAIETRGAVQAVTSAGIYRAMSKHLREAAVSYRLAVEASLRPGFVAVEDIYSQLPIQFVAPDLPAPKRPPIIDFSDIEDSGIIREWSDVPVESYSRTPSLHWMRESAPRLFRDRLQGFVIIDPAQETQRRHLSPRSIAVSSPVRVIYRETGYFPDFKAGRRLIWSAQSYELSESWQSPQLPASFLVEIEEDLWVGAATFPDLAITICRPLPTDNVTVPGDDIRLVYGAHEEYEHVYQVCQGILSELNAGLLTPEQALSIATRVRHFKHVNPLFGVVAAYLYDAVGDRDSIRRTASFYPQYDQPVPFDIALLAGVPGRRGRDGRLRIDLPAVPARTPRTPEEAENIAYFDAGEAINNVVVAGGFPWMGKGWDLLDLARLPVHPEVITLAGHVGPSLFTTLGRDGGRKLAALIEEGKV
jgi:hypothetical protein